MKRSDFHFDLPPDLIAHYPAAQRAGSRLLCLDGSSGSVEHAYFANLQGLLRAGDLLVFNDTRVIPARLYGEKASGGQVEILLERILGASRALAQIKASKSPRAGSQIHLYARGEEHSGVSVQVCGRQQNLFELDFGAVEVLPLLDRIGHVPLPPYIQRPDEVTDLERYQTVYARQPGAVAAPTAGLHFDDDMLESLRRGGINTAFVTLHVGAGTFQPVRVDQLADHIMHSEYAEISAGVCQLLETTVRTGGRVIAVGTTSVRCLESACTAGVIQPYRGDTDIFIYPGYQFQCVDALITNFHLPESTLIMLVSAFAGREQVLEAYRQAVVDRYRFFSYGDAMWITAQQRSLLRQRIVGEQ